MPQTMPKNPAWRKKKDEPLRPRTLAPDYTIDAATGPSRQVRRRAGRILVAREAAADRVVELAARYAPLKRRQAERQSAARMVAEIVEVAA